MLLKRILLTITSALLAAAVFPPFDLWLLALVAWIPLLLAIKGASPRSAFYLGLLHGFIVYGITLSWLWEIFSHVAISLWGILALFTAIFALTVAKMPKFSPVWIALLWTGIEYFRSEVFVLSFTWITPGTGLPPGWITPILGVYGVTFMVIFASSMTVTNWKIGLPLAVVPALCVFLFPKATPNTEPIAVGLLQNESGFPYFYYEQSLDLFDEVDVLLWPEYSLGEYTGPIEAITKSFSGNVKLVVAAGTEVRDGVKRNTAFGFTRDGIIGRHVKNHPVHLFDDGVPGETTEAIETEFGKVGMPICFDCDHQDVVRKMTGSGAEFFLVPSMDAEHWTSRQHEQHGILFRHRAAENGRWLAVASSSGVTQIIDSKGHVLSRLPLMDEANLVGKIYPDDQTTIYRLFGWVFGPAMMIAAAILLPVTHWRARKRLSKKVA